MIYDPRRHRLTFHNRTHLTHEFIASANGSVLDSPTLYKAHDFSSTVTGNGAGSGNGNVNGNVNVNGGSHGNGNG